MIDISQRHSDGLVTVRIEGRIDSLTSQTIQQYLENLTESGERRIILDFSQINYISSAGLRILLLIQKQLKKVEGEIVLCNLSPAIADVFRMSGFYALFRVLHSPEEICTLNEQAVGVGFTQKQNIAGIEIEYITNGTPPGHLDLIGSQQKMAVSEYSETDICAVKAGDMQYGLGFAALGDDYESSKNFFGEAVVVNSSLFYYPAVKRPVVDYMLITTENASLEYKFFFGLNVSGKFSRVLAFECREEFADLKKLAAVITELSSAPATGVVLIAESKGLLGMFLKKVPIIDNKPTNGLSIYSNENFAEWMDFPVEPTDFNRTVIACGLAVRDKAAVPASIARLLPDQSNIHLHGAVFEKGPLNKKPAHFHQELKRIVNESEVSKVMHLLDASRFGSGLIGLIDLAF
jgi:anti-anti-sigma factor